MSSNDLIERISAGIFEEISEGMLRRIPGVISGGIFAGTVVVWCVSYQNWIHVFTFGISAYNGSASVHTLRFTLPLLQKKKKKIS